MKKKSSMESVRRTAIETIESPDLYVASSDLLDQIAFALAISDPLVTPKGRRELRWDKDFDHEEKESYKTMARVVVACLEMRDQDIEGLKAKISKYESFLHKLQMHAEVRMDGEKVAKLVSNACSWSFAHRAGNGAFSVEEQDELVANALEKLDLV